MYLFDVVRKLNDEIAGFLNKGMSGSIHPKLTATTDGYVVHIHFVDALIWSSADWVYERDQTNPTDSDIEYELFRIERHLKHRVMENLLNLYNIQW